MPHIVDILSIGHLTHDVLYIIARKPAGLKYQPGQAADVSLHQEGWHDALRAFTFTSLPQDEFIEFAIKTYPEHKGVTAQMLQLKKGDELMIHDVFGDIAYKGPGTFIAGGAGITPFIAIFKQLEKNGQLDNNQLLFANKTRADIIKESWFQTLLGNRFINVLSHEAVAGYEQGFISADIIQKYAGNNAQYFYLCGPPPMMTAVEAALQSLGIGPEWIVKETF